MKLTARLIAILIVGVVVVAAAVSALAVSASAQRARNRGQVHSMQATLDHGAVHADKYALTTNATITCMSATSDVPNATPVPQCRIVANGFSGTMAPKSNATLKPGDITLTCAGPGTMLRCDARVDVPAPTQ